MMKHLWTLPTKCNCSALLSTTGRVQLCCFVVFVVFELNQGTRKKSEKVTAKVALLRSSQNCLPHLS